MTPSVFRRGELGAVEKKIYILGVVVVKFYLYMLLFFTLRKLKRKPLPSVSPRRGWLALISWALPKVQVPLCQRGLFFPRNSQGKWCWRWWCLQSQPETFAGSRSPP